MVSSAVYFYDYQVVWVYHGRTLRTFTEGLSQLVLVFYASAVDQPVLLVAAVVVYSWDWSRFRVLVKCPVVGA